MANSLTALYDAVLIPVITVAKTDQQSAALDNEQRDSVEQGIRNIVESISAAFLPQFRLIGGDQRLVLRIDKITCPTSSREFFFDLLEAVRLEDDLRLGVAHDIPSKLFTVDD